MVMFLILRRNSWEFVIWFDDFDVYLYGMLIKGWKVYYLEVIRLFFLIVD